MSTQQSKAIGETVTNLLAWAEATGLGKTATPIQIRYENDGVTIEWYGTVGNGSNDDYQVYVYIAADGELMRHGFHRRWDNERGEMGDLAAFDTTQIIGYAR